MLHLDMPSIELGVTHTREHVESLEDMRDGSLVERTRTHLLRWITVIGSLMARKMTMKMTKLHTTNCSSWLPEMRKLELMLQLVHERKV